MNKYTVVRTFKAVSLLNKLSKLRKQEMNAHVRAVKLGCSGAALQRRAKYEELSTQADAVEAELRELLTR